MGPKTAATSEALRAEVRVIPERHGRQRRRQGFEVTARDRELLRFIAAQRFALGCHAQALLGRDRAVAYRRLAGLVDAGLLSYRRIFYGEPGVFQVTHGGLAIIDSSLPKARIDLRTYRHDVGTSWLWIYARRGWFGSEGRVLSERELRSLDQDPDRRPGEEPFGVRVEGYDRGGRPRVHHPDVLVLDQRGDRVAVELELSLKSRRRLESIVLGYSTSIRLRRVVYLTDRAAVTQSLQAVVDGYGLDGLIEVHYVPEQRSDRQWWMWRSLNRQQEAGT